ncbi:hypothetical protein PSAC2689_110010 [Paraburkholderia sacchari]
MFRYIKIYRGGLMNSIMLTLLFGFLHWRKLMQESKRRDAK